jgi:hypothetical protein
MADFFIMNQEKNPIDQIVGLNSKDFASHQFSDAHDVLLIKLTDKNKEIAIA